MTAFQAPDPLSDPPPYPTSYLSAIADNNDDLHREITTLAGHINAANYRFLKLLAVLVERGAWNGAGIKSAAHWLNYYCGISLGPAREKMPDADDEPDTFPRKRAEALVRMAEHALATAADGPVALTGGDRFRVVVHINAKQATGHQRQNTNHEFATPAQSKPFAWIEDGPALSP